MKSLFISSLSSLQHPVLCILLYIFSFTINIQAEKDETNLEKVEQTSDQDITIEENLPLDEPENSNKIKSRILLTNGDRLTGEPHNFNNQGNLQFTSKSLREIAAFPLSKLLTLELDTWKNRSRPETVARLQLQPRFDESVGDTILGTLSELTPESVKLETWYGGVITVKRKMVQSLQIINSGPGSYFGPNSIKEWKLSDGSDSWKFKNGALCSMQSGNIGRDVELKEKSHISFDVKWKSSMKFHVHLYSSNVEESRPDAYYDVNFNNNYAWLKTRGKAANGGVVARGGRWQNIKYDSERNQAHVDLFVDRKAGIITIYINGEHACILQSQSPDPSNLGTGLSFIAEERYPIEVSGISVSPWNGTTLPNQTVTLNDEQKEAGDKASTEPPHRIILKNGDQVPGTVGKVQEGRMIIETKFTPIRIPLNRIKSLSLGESDDKPQPRKYPGDVRAWFHDGGFVTLRLASFQEGRITGFSQAFGDVSLDLNAFSKIDFHIYDAENNELRKNLN